MGECPPKGACPSNVNESIKSRQEGNILYKLPEQSVQDPEADQGVLRSGKKEAHCLYFVLSGCGAGTNNGLHHTYAPKEPHFFVSYYF